MANENMTRWTVMVSKKTDDSLCSFMSDRGMQEGGRPKFIEEAVKWRIFDRTLNEAREMFADMAPDDLQTLLNEALTRVRAEMPPLATPKNS